MKLGEDITGLYSSSTLLQKVGQLGLELPDDLAKLAVARGLRYYDGKNEGAQLRQESRLQVSISVLSNAELAIAMLSPDLPEGTASEIQVRQRIAAAVLSARDVDASSLAELSIRERCVPILRWIASCGAEVEPDNEFWRGLLDQLPELEKPERVPHPTRFVAMSGINRGEKKISKQWIRLKAPLLS